MQSFAAGSRIRPGQRARYAIFVWSRQAAGRQVSVTIKAGKAPHVGSSAFTVCPRRARLRCIIGTLRTGQTIELESAIPVRSAAQRGEHVRLTALASAANAKPASSAATVVVRAPARPEPPAPTPAPTVGGGAGPAAPATPAANPLPAPTLPPVTVAPSNPSGLFPTVSPRHSTRSSAPAATRPARHRSGQLRTAADAATTPLGERLIGGQLIGLVVLAAAIAMAITRLSLRTRRDGGDKKA